MKNADIAEVWKFCAQFNEANWPTVYAMPCVPDADGEEPSELAVRFVTPASDDVPSMNIAFGYPKGAAPDLFEYHKMHALRALLDESLRLTSMR